MFVSTVYGIFFFFSLSFTLPLFSLPHRFSSANANECIEKHQTAKEIILFIYTHIFKIVHASLKHPVFSSFKSANLKMCVVSSDKIAPVEKVWMFWINGKWIKNIEYNTICVGPTLFFFFFFILFELQCNLYVEMIIKLLSIAHCSLFIYCITI